MIRAVRPAGTLLPECLSARNGAAVQEEITLKFSDAKDGRLLNDLVFDVEKW